VTWTISAGDDVQTHVLHIAENDGIVQWDTPEGDTLALKK
jgi:hypothetical protein